MDGLKREKLLGFILSATLIAVIALTLVSLFTRIDFSLNLIELLLGLSMLLQANLNWSRRRVVSILCLLCAVTLWAFVLVDYLR